MGQKFQQLLPEHIDFIKEQKLFFVATAAPHSRINMSPKGMDSLRILSPHHLVWLNLTGSANETAAHLRQDNRMTIMFCSFDKKPLILRLYGQAQCWHEKDQAFALLLEHFPVMVGARQIIEMTIDLVHSSCGYGVPICESIRERRTLAKWSENKGEAGIRQYWQDHNRFSLDGEETGIADHLG